MIRRAQRSRTRGFTLIEVIMAASISAIVLGGLTSALLLSSRVVEQAATTSATEIETDRVFDEIVQNLTLARTLGERRPNSIAFTVPDRDGDGRAELIRYAWANQGTGPLTMEFNDNEAITLLPDVSDFTLNYDELTIAGTGGVSVVEESGTFSILFVARKAHDLEQGEIVRIFQLQAWGYTVNVIDDEADAAEFDAAFADNDVLYIPDRVAADKLGDTIINPAIGVVLENRRMVKEMLLGEKEFNKRAVTNISLDDVSHYITKEFTAGLFPVFLDNEEFIHSDGHDLATGAQALASELGEDENLALVVLDTGDMLFDGSTSADRRVILPWGEDTQFNRLTSDSLTLFQRALQWAAHAEIEDVEDNQIYVHGIDPDGDDKDGDLKSKSWVAASVVPQLDPNATSWKVTRVRFRAQQKGDPDSTIVIQIVRRDTDGTPLTDVLAQEFMFESDLPLLYDWVEVEVSMTESLLPDEGVCVAIGMMAGDEGGEVHYQKNKAADTPFNQFYKGQPGDWDNPKDEEDMPCELFGTQVIGGGG